MLLRIDIDFNILLTNTLIVLLQPLRGRVNNNSVLVAQLETMYPQVKFLFMGVAALTLVIVNIFWDKVELITLISWASISTLLIIIRAFFLIYS